MKPVKMKNLYNGEVVVCEDLEKITRTESGINFVTVYKEEKPERTFLVNREAYKILSS